MMYKVALVPVDLALFFAIGDSGDDLQKCALAATRWSEDRSEVAAGKYRGNIGEQRLDFAVLSNGKRDIPEFEHGGNVAKAVVSDNANSHLNFAGDGTFPSCFTSWQEVDWSGSNDSKPEL